MEPEKIWQVRRPHSSVQVLNSKFEANHGTFSTAFASTLLKIRQQEVELGTRLQVPLKTYISLLGSACKWLHQQKNVPLQIPKLYSLTHKKSNGEAKPNFGSFWERALKTASIKKAHEHEAYLRKGLSWFAEEPKLLFQLSHVHMMKYDIDEAIKFAMATIKVDEKHVDAYYNLGQCLWMQNKLYEAKRAFLKGVEINPQDSQMWDCLATIQAEIFLKDQINNAIEEAFEFQKRWGELTPGIEMVHQDDSFFRFGFNLKLHNKFTLAKQCFEKINQYNYPDRNKNIKLMNDLIHLHQYVQDILQDPEGIGRIHSFLGDGSTLGVVARLKDSNEGWLRLTYDILEVACDNFYLFNNLDEMLHRQLPFEPVFEKNNIQMVSLLVVTVGILHDLFAYFRLDSFYGPNKFIRELAIRHVWGKVKNTKTLDIIQLIIASIKTKEIREILRDCPGMRTKTDENLISKVGRLFNILNSYWSIWGSEPAPEGPEFSIV